MFCCVKKNDSPKSSKENIRGSGNNGFTDFQQSALNAHNSARKHHQVGPLTLNADLCAFAQRWSEQMAREHSMRHSPGDTRTYRGQRMGENVAMKYDSRMPHYTGSQATSQWYNEVHDYDFITGQGRGVVGHFTQVVWKDSRELGIGRAQASDGAWYVTANYFPPGNYVGKNMENVFRPKNGRPMTIADDEPASNVPVNTTGLKSASPKGGIKGRNKGFNGREDAMNGQDEGVTQKKWSTHRSTRTITKTVNGVKTTTRIITETRINADGTTEEITTEETL